MYLGVSGERNTTSPQAYTATFTTSAATLVENSTLAITVQLDRAAEQDLALTVSTPTLPSGVTETWPSGTQGLLRINQGQTTASFNVIAALGIMNAQQFAYTIQAGTQITPGSPATVTVTTQVITQGSSVGFPWIGGISGYGRQTISATFSVGQNEGVATAYEIVSEDCQVDTILEMGEVGGTGRKNLLCTGFISTNGTQPGDGTEVEILGKGAAGTAPSEAGTYDVADPWTGFSITMNGLPLAVGATGNDAVATFTSPVDSYALLGTGAPGNSGPDLMRKEVRMAFLETGEAVPLNRAAAVVVCATRRVDIDAVMYEVMVTNSYMNSADNPTGSNNTQPGPVSFDTLDIALPTDASGYTMRMLDDFSGSGGHNIGSGQIVRSWGGGNYHVLESGMMPGWTVLAYNAASVSSAQAEEILEGRNCGAVVEGFGSITTAGKGLTSQNIPVYNWHDTPEAPSVSYAQLDNFAVDKLGYWKPAMLSGTSGGVHAARTGLHIRAGEGAAGGPGPVLVHAMNITHTCAPNEVAALRYSGEALSRRTSVAVIKDDEARPVFCFDFTTNSPNAVAGRNVDYTLVGSLGQQQDPTRHQIPCLTLAGTVSSSGHPDVMVARAFIDDDTGSRSTVSGESWRDPLTSAPTYDYWSPDCAHLGRMMNCADSWYIGQSFLGWMTFQLHHGWAERFLTSYPPTNQQGYGSPASGGLNARSSKGTFSRQFVPSGQALMAYARFDRSSMYSNTGEPQFYEMEVSQSARSYGWSLLACTDGLALLKDSTLRDNLLPTRAPSPFDEHSVLRLTMYWLGHVATDFGMMHTTELRNQSNPDAYYDSASNPSGQPAIVLRNIQEQRGCVPNGSSYPQSAVTSTPDGLGPRVNYDENNADQDEHRSYVYAWQEAIVSTSLAAAAEHLTAAGESFTDSLITDSHKVLQNSYWFVHSCENHPAATATSMPSNHFWTKGPGANGQLNTPWTLQQIENGESAWHYDLSYALWHYFYYGAIGYLNAGTFLGSPQPGSILEGFKKFEGVGTQTDADFRQFLKQYMYEYLENGRIVTSNQFEVDRLYVMAWLSSQAQPSHPLDPWSPDDIGLPQPAP